MVDVLPRLARHPPAPCVIWPWTHRDGINVCLRRSRAHQGTGPWATGRAATEGVSRAEPRDGPVESWNTSINSSAGSVGLLDGCRWCAGVPITARAAAGPKTQPGRVRALIGRVFLAAESGDARGAEVQRSSWLPMEAFLTVVERSQWWSAVRRCHWPALMHGHGCFVLETQVQV
jgi:hypothetical protein